MNPETKKVKCDLCSNKQDLVEMTELFHKKGHYTSNRPKRPRDGVSFVLPAYIVCESCAKKLYENGTIE